jgi:hypothetical protein
MEQSLIPTSDQLEAGIKAFLKNEPRFDAYLKSQSQINNNWGKADEMAKGVKILLDSWHMNFYRFGRFDLPSLTICIASNLDSLQEFNLKFITNYSEKDEDAISLLFKNFLEALRGGKNRSCRSPVAVAKALHLFAPNYFPLWDNYIALEFNTLWGSASSGTFCYLTFCFKMKTIVAAVKEYDCVKNPIPNRSILKLVDEYYYSKYTKHWI